MLKFARYAVLVSALALMSLPAGAREFKAWLAELRAAAQAKGISDRILDAALGQIKPIPRVIELDRRQPEFRLTFRQYLDRVVPA